MQPMPAALLQCPKCEAVVDFSVSKPDESHVICTKCGHDFGTYRNVKNAANRAIKAAQGGPYGNITKH